MDTTIFRTLETLKEKAQDALFQIQACLFQPAAKIKVNGRSFKIVKILGEGGFSFVYLAQDEASGVSGF
jgi:serine/threonine kinase 16